MSDRLSDLRKEALKAGGNKSMADAVGMPDEKDKAFLRRLIRRYDRNHPGLLAYTIQQARQDQFENSTTFKNISKYGLVDQVSSRRHIFEFPESLIATIEQYYPTIFRDKKHFGWFVHNFPELMLPEKF